MTGKPFTISERKLSEVLGEGICYQSALFAAYFMTISAIGEFTCIDAPEIQMGLKDVPFVPTVAKTEVELGFIGFWV